MPFFVYGPTDDRIAIGISKRQARSPAYRDEATIKLIRNNSGDVAYQYDAQLSQGAESKRVSI